MNIGIVGAGFIGKAVARLLLDAEHRVMIANSRGSHTLCSLRTALGGIETGDVAQACTFGDMILLAIPFSHYHQLPVTCFADKIVIDAGNYYPQRDGRIPALDKHQTTTSELLASHLSSATVVKALNAILAGDLAKDSRPADASDRRGLPIAGNDADAKARVSRLLDDIGYDVVDAGALSESWRFERARPAYCINVNKANLAHLLNTTERYVDLPDTRWSTN